MDDASILEQFRKKETRNYAFDQLVKKYQKKLYWIIRRMVIDHQDANDVLQDVFIKVYKNLHNFREDSQLYTWLYRIATNETLTFLKNKRKRFFIPIVDVEQELTEKLTTNSSPESDEISHKLQQSILTLPEKQRIVFNMRYFEELSYKDMSEILGTSEGALKASYHHAVKKIEKYLRED